MADNRFVQRANAMREELISTRRDLHAHPELGFEEVRTAGIVAQRLTNLGLEVRTGVGKTGVVALLEGDHDGPTVLVRADMDALPILEDNDVPSCAVPTFTGTHKKGGHAIGLPTLRRLGCR